MPALKRPISASLSPNATAQSLRTALSYLCNPLRWTRWKRGPEIERLERTFKEMFHAPFAKSFDGGRTALYAVIEALQLEEHDEVFLQSFTCVVVPNAILAARAVPVFVDIDESYNMSVESLKRAIKASTHPKAVIIQHSFGQPADVEAFRAVCDEYGMVLVEDCAHSLGASAGGKLVGTVGDAAMFSFGRDKIISSVSGGMAITSHPEIGTHLNRIWLGMRFPGLLWIKQRLLHQPIFAIAKRLYYTCSIGKVIIHLGKALRLLPLVLEQKEKQEAKQKAEFRMPNALAAIANGQMEQLRAFNAHRQELAGFYDEQLSSLPAVVRPCRLPNTEPIYLRYTIQAQKTDALLQYAKQRGILLGDWYRPVIAPAGTNMAAAGYEAGSCPVAEQLSDHVVNLPTSPETTLDDARHVISIIKEFYASREQDTD